MVDPGTPIWKMRWTRQPNFVHAEYPYIPMSLGNIDLYTKLDDYSEDHIKKIETTGILIPIQPNIALLLSTTNDPQSSLYLAIEHLCTEYIYPIDANGVCRGLRVHIKSIPDFQLYIIGHCRIPCPHRAPLSLEIGANTFYLLQNSWDAVKVFGTLETRNDEVVLVVDYIVQVEDFASYEKTLDLMAKLARTKYSMYDYNRTTNTQLHSYLDTLINDKENGDL